MIPTRGDDDDGDDDDDDGEVYQCQNNSSSNRRAPLSSRDTNLKMTLRICTLCTEYRPLLRATSRSGRLKQINFPLGGVVSESSPGELANVPPGKLVGLKPIPPRRG